MKRRMRLGASACCFACVLLAGGDPAQARIARGESPSARPLGPTTLTARLAREKPVEAGWAVHDFKDEEGFPELVVGDRLTLQVNTASANWVYALAVYSPFAWKLLWSSGPDLGGGGGGERVDSWIAGEDLAGATRLVVVASALPLPGLAALVSARNCGAPGRAPAGWPLDGTVAGSGEDAVCNTQVAIESLIPRSRLEGESWLALGPPVTSLFRDREELPAVFNAADGFGVAVAVLPIVGTRTARAPEPMLLESWTFWKRPTIEILENAGVGEDRRRAGLRILHDGTWWTYDSNREQGRGWQRERTRLRADDVSRLAASIRAAGVLEQKDRWKRADWRLDGTIHRWSFAVEGGSGRVYWSARAGTPPAIRRLKPLVDAALARAR